MALTSSKFPMVGIGAAAGGIPAMEGFFKGLPGDPGMAFIIVTHLNPERESLLHEVVERLTTMRVQVAVEGMRVEINTVYVMPRNAILGIDKGVLHVRRHNVHVRERKPIDIFFSELARDRGEHAVGVILSGGDSDGTLGIKAIKEHGGLTLAQIPNELGPRNPDMPRSAISTGLVDISAPADMMGVKLVAFAASLAAPADFARESSGPGAADQAQATIAIHEILHNHSGHDFAGYKQKTFLRRVKRRMHVRQVQRLSAYAELLRDEPEELAALFRDLLINVTSFFRDEDAFAFFDRTIVPKLFEQKGAADTVRVWVPGCATGEEVFSIGILIREYMDTLKIAPQAKIFATDIDEAALSVARAARYPAAMLDGLTAERKRRFFTSDGSSYVLSKEIRELCVFSPHNIIRDPPFSRMDLVSCRNLLIYLGPDIQNRVIPTFHYSLKNGGYLFLGASEGISRYDDLFEIVDKKHRVFRVRDLPPSTSRLPVSVSRTQIGHPLRQAVEAQVLERFAPPHLVVNGEGDVAYYSAGTGKYLEASQGAPSRQLLAMARGGLRMVLRAALREAMTSHNTAVRDNVLIESDEDRAELIRLTVEPLAQRTSQGSLYLVLFESRAPIRKEQGRLAQSPEVDGVALLERELRDTRERLQSTIEEYETALEELRSANEELLSINEEAQSNNEELEASKEEMHSLNQELNTINAELNGKIDELDRANRDLRNLFESTRIATVFLDDKLVVRSYTPAASSFFNLRPADIGRPLTDLSSRLDYPELKEHIGQVFESGQDIAHQLGADSMGHHYLVRLIPYRNEQGEVQGVVVTLIDVTELAQAEERHRVLVAELNHRVKNMLSIVISVAKQTMEKSGDKEAFNEALSGRLHAMGRAYGHLSRDDWKKASVMELTTQELEPFEKNRWSIEGPEIDLPPEQGLSLGMVIHELATNAVKYGALSEENGRIAISWAIKDKLLHICWRELGGPEILHAAQPGFGLSLIKGEIEYRLRGRIETDFTPAGLVARIAIPLEVLRNEHEKSSCACSSSRMSG